MDERFFHNLYIRLVVSEGVSKGTPSFLFYNGKDLFKISFFCIFTD